MCAWCVHDHQAAIWETGMDNSPMYDQVTWAPDVNKMLVIDNLRLSDCQRKDNAAQRNTTQGNQIQVIIVRMDSPLYKTNNWGVFIKRFIF